MSEFVNFKKRNINLPPGCKDLFDLLHPASRQKNLSFAAGNIVGKMPEWMHKIKTNSFIQGEKHLSEIGKYVDMFLHSKTTVCHLSISSLGKRVVFNLENHPVKGSEICASVEVEIGTKEEEKLRQFLKRNGLTQLGDSNMPTGFPSAIPTYIFCKVLPLPTENAALTRLAMDLFGETCGLKETDDVGVLYLEMTYPPEAPGYFNKQG